MRPLQGLTKVEVKTLENQSRNEGQALRNEIQHLKQTVTKLESELQDAKTNSQPEPLAPSLQKLQTQVKEQQQKLAKQDSNILSLEAQLRQLGAYNDELLAQLKEEETEELKGWKKSAYRRTNQFTVP